MFIFVYLMTLALSQVVEDIVKICKELGYLNMKQSGVDPPPPPPNIRSQEVFAYLIFSIAQAVD
jgi:hypothetical protein